MNKTRRQTLKLTAIDNSEVSVSVVGNFMFHVPELTRKTIDMFMHQIEKRTIKYHREKYNRNLLCVRTKKNVIIYITTHGARC